MILVLVALEMLAGLPAMQPSASQPAQTTLQAPAANFTSAEQLLDALEEADADLRTLQSDIQYDRVFGIAGDRQIRQGGLVYVDPRPAGQASTSKQGRKFAIRITSVQIGERREQDDRQLIFDGEWFVERDNVRKLFQKRHVARPGDGFDPLKLGEGPFPLPIGQKKADILRRYEVALLTAGQDLEANDPGDEAAKASLEAFVKGSYQLKLTPKPEIIESEELKEIRLWYRPVVGPAGQTTLLPRMARTINRAADVTLVSLINVKTNQPVDADAISTMAPKEGWDVQIEELPGAGQPGALIVPGAEPSKPQTGDPK